MFQSQLFKRSFINTSLLIIQRKMNEKMLAKQRSQVQEKINEKKKILVVTQSNGAPGKKPSTTPGDVKPGNS
jgi:hypothetical protein